MHLHAEAPWHAPHRADGAGPYFAAWAGTYSFPSLLVSLDLDLIWANRSAVMMLEDGRDFAVTGGALACADTQQADGLRALVEGLQTEDGPRAWAYRTGEGRHRVVRAETLHAPGLPPAVALMIFPTDPVYRWVWCDLTQVFGLTPAEASVARQLVEGGGGAEQIAETLGISIETVRTHVRRLYVKLGVNGREQLFAKVSPFRVT
jgi:DNA-binding CsgD family transcriptional regulator